MAKMAKPANAFAGLSDILGTGVDALFADTNTQYALVYLDQIEISEQIREIFEDEENTLDDLAASIKARGLLQPILLRPTASGYALVAGERRYRASKLAGLEQIPAYIRVMTDEEAEDAQLAENIHRKNLTQIEEAKKIQRDLDRLGSVESVLAKHQKSRAWLSKMLGLLNLPEQAKRLVTENVSADVEVINTVKIIEKVDAEAAKKLVDELKETRGKENAREKVAAVKGKVKPSKNTKPAASGTRVVQDEPVTPCEWNPSMVYTPNGGLVHKDSAMAKPEFWNNESETRGRTPVADGQDSNNTGEQNDSGNTQLDPVRIFADAKINDGQDAIIETNTVTSPEEILRTAYNNIVEFDANPHVVVSAMSDAEHDCVEKWLKAFYDDGMNKGKAGRAVIEGIRCGRFSTEGEGAFALVSFIHGLEALPRFNLIEILSSVKK